MNLGRWTLALAFGCLPVLLAPRVILATPVFFSENFNSAALNSNLEDPNNAYVLSGGTIQQKTGGTAAAPAGQDRFYIRTATTDYNTVDFVAEITVIERDISGGGLLYFGLGSGIRDSGYYFEPTGSVQFRVHSSNFDYNAANGRVDAARTPYGGTFDILDEACPGRQFYTLNPSGTKFRLQLVKHGNSVTFAIDDNYDGIFSADDSYTYDSGILQANWLNNSNSRIYFGTTGLLDKFDDFVIRPFTEQPVPEPSTVFLFGTGILGLAGVARRRMKE